MHVDEPLAGSEKPECPDLSVMTRALDEVLRDPQDADNGSVPGKARDSGEWIAFATVGLDGYSLVYEAFGHLAADMLVNRVASELEMLPTKLHTSRRIGNAEFGVLLAGSWKQRSEAREACLRFASELSSALRAMLALDDGVEIRIVTSCGFTVVPRDSSLFSEEIVASAEIARKQVLQVATGERVREFEPQMLQEIQERVATISGVRRGLPRGELELHLQPVVDIDRRILSCEALLRWNSPARGLVPPDEFIHLAEQTGMIVDIGRWVLDQACQTLASWSTVPAMRDLQMSVNVSVIQLEDESFVDDVLAAIEKYNLPPKRLLLEVTEGILHRDAERSVAILTRLREAGVCTSLDDFGTGYSSLSYLRQLPVAQLKIDRSFVRAIGSSPDDLEIIRMITQLGHALKLQVVAEGVETEEQFRPLSALGIDRYQGWLFGKALPAPEFQAVAE